MQNQVSTTNANAPAKPQSGIALLKAALNADSVQKQFQNALRENKDLFIASIIDLYNGDKALQKCNPNAIITEALRAAVLDLPLAKALGFAYIVVYNNNVKQTDPNTGRDVWVKVPTPTFIPGYKGYIQLAMRSGQYRILNADVVREGELKSHNKLTGEADISGEATSDKITGYFAYFQLLNGYTKMMYMSVPEMAAYAKQYSPGVKFNDKISVADLIAKANDNAQSTQVGWLGNFNDMAIKTVLRRLISKYGPMSIKMSNVVASDIDSETKALGTREETAQLAASPPAIDLNADDSVDFEEIDTETGEVKTNAAASAPAIENDPY
ncbi:MAG: recombinase RecT [Ruminococcus sp.]|nr:recombinase RecT [Ruminococcus sp.]